MPSAIIDGKGRLTVPKDVRERLGLKSGERLVFEVEDDSVRLRVERRKSLGELMGSLPATREYAGKGAEREAARGYLVRRMQEGP